MCSTFPPMGEWEGSWLPQRFTLSLPFPPPPSCCFEIKAFPKIGASESIPGIAGLGGKRAISQVKLCLQSPKLCLTFLIPRKEKEAPFRLAYRSAGEPTCSIAVAAQILFALNAPERLFSCHFWVKSSRVHFLVGSRIQVVVHWPPPPYLTKQRVCRQSRLKSRWSVSPFSHRCSSCSQGHRRFL